MGMAPNGTLLCTHRDPAQLSLLQENGYQLVTANNGHDGLRLPEWIAVTRLLKDVVFVKPE